MSSSGEAAMSKEQIARSGSQEVQRGSHDSHRADSEQEANDATTPTQYTAPSSSQDGRGEQQLDGPVEEQDTYHQADGASDTQVTESEASIHVSSEAGSDEDVQSEVRTPKPPSVRTDFPDNESSSGPQSTVNTSRPPSTPLPAGSMVFVTTALESIASSKEARRKKPLSDSVQNALSVIKKGGQIDPEDVFEPLRLATETESMPLTTTALDCIGKLITYSYFSMPSHLPHSAEPEKQPPPLIERAIDTICDCFQDEATTNEVQLQIVKSLLAAVLNDKFIVHGAGLLKAVRQVYNIFLLSKSPANQQVAQGTLTQMVGTVFERVQLRLQHKEARMNISKVNGESDAVDDDQTERDGVSIRDSIDNGTEAGDYAESEASSQHDRERSTSRPRAQKLTLQDFENARTFDDNRIGDNVPTMVTRVKTYARGNRSVSGQSTLTDSGPVDEDEEDEVFIKDAYLVFRSMCRLSMKQNTPEQLQDPRGQQLRSKMVALAIIRTLLNNYMEIFNSPLVAITGSTSNERTSFGHAINQYLRLVIGRNGPSAVKQVFETTSEIFWLVLKDMRVMMKREIEVFFKEIYLSILERRNVPTFQRLYLLRILRRLSDDPKALVELYLNYDCDRSALDNMFQRVIELMSRLSSTPIGTNAQQHVAGLEHSNKEVEFDVDWREHGRIPPPLTTMALGQSSLQDTDMPIEVLLKQGSLECLIRTLRSLRDWSQDLVPSPNAPLSESGENLNVDDSRSSMDPSRAGASPKPSAAEVSEGPSTPAAEDDPSQFEKAKARKTAMSNAIRQFNFKPKRGIKALLSEGFIVQDTPEEVGRFIFEHDQLDKTMIGEYLGEGDAYNIAVMHAFVDRMDFSNRSFVDAMRSFLQSFRLPGEAQKIDRFLLKFAERYHAGNPSLFANADTAYVLSYSVIMLNVDQHSSKIKDKRMTIDDFIKNNRGINDNADLPPEYLTDIYKNISGEEIVLKTEREHAAAIGLLQPGKQSAQQADLEMSSKAEERLRSLLKAQKKLASSAGISKYVSATSSKHVGPMFSATWMSFLSGLSAQMQTTQNLETIRTCMEGIRLAIHISCVFELDTPRDAFVAALANATNLGNLREMMVKNLEALKMLLDIALNEGNLLKSSWSSVLTCISQLDRFQLITGGVDEEFIPDVRKAMPNLNQQVGSGSARVRQLGPSKRPRTQSTLTMQSEIAQEARSSQMTKTVDRIFTGTEFLSGDAIVHFVRALCEVSWQEIQSSGGSDTPRMYSLQKLVEISYYNMRRVRFEWTKIWEVLGDHFNEVACQGNTNVVFFALDSLRQLSMRFMEIAELPNFQFQKDFLKPFKHVMTNSTAVNVKDMVLRCLVQMITARGDNIRSGWKTIFGVFSVAAREPYESLVSVAFDHVQQIYETRFGVVITQGAFPDFIVCLTEFSKNLKFQKKALSAIEALKATIPRLLKTPECPLAHTEEEKKEANGAHEGNVPVSRYAPKEAQQEQFWFPVLFAFHDILMTGEDLEVRSQALNYLFDALIKYGQGFPPEFWDVLWRQLLYPIFMVLKSKSEMSKAPNHEDLSVWLSTTMIQALRNMITLFTHYFDSLEYMLDRFLDLLALCICQENDTIARIGSNCMQTLILQNVAKFNEGHWHKVVNAFVSLFERTTAHQLFTAATASPAQQSVGEDDEYGSGVSAPDEAGLQVNGQETGALEAAAGESSTPVSPTSVPTQEATSTRNTTSESQAVASEEKSTEERPIAQRQPIVVTAARRRFFNRIITRCVLQLLMIETVNELFMNSEVYAQIPSPELLRLMGLLKKSYAFAKKFNNDKDLRLRLWHEGFMKQPPNLLKQESGSAATYVSILVRMYFDEGEERRRNRAETEAALIPLCADIIRSYVELDEETQQRNIVAWRPVVVDTLEAYTNFPAADFDKHVETFYPLAVDLLSRDMDRETRLALQALLRRMGELRMGMPQTFTPLATPTSPRPGGPFMFSRRPSRIGSR